MPASLFHVATRTNDSLTARRLVPGRGRQEAADEGGQQQRRHCQLGAAQDHGCWLCGSIDEC